MKNILILSVLAVSAVSSAQDFNWSQNTKFLIGEPPQATINYQPWKEVRLPQGWGYASFSLGFGTTTDRNLPVYGADLKWNQRWDPSPDKSWSLDAGLLCSGFYVQDGGFAFNDVSARIGLFVGVNWRR